MNKKNEETINEVDNNIIPADPYARFEALKASEQAADAPEEESTHNPEEAISEQSEQSNSSDLSDKSDASDPSDLSDLSDLSDQSDVSEPSEQDEKAEPSSEPELRSFADLGVEPRLLHAIEEMGFEHPMPIQEMVIPHLLNRQGDVVGLAQTGTGKTAAFGLPLLQRIDVSENKPQALIIAPTRELCLQIASDLADFSKYVDGLRVLPVYGGSSIESQIRTLRKGVQVIVATPGRLIDLIKRGEVKLNSVHTVILDEADEMLNMGFLDDINEILTHVPDDRKMLMFSATMPKEIAGIAKRFMHDPVEFVAGNRNEGTKNVRHIYYMVKAHDKYLALKRVVDNSPNIYGIVFCRTKKETQEIADKLIADGYNADCLHGDLSQAQRDLAMKKFRDHVTQLLVATDVAARGLDVDDLTHVINFGLPDDVAVYTHRSGRTGRANKTGVSIAIIHSRERSKIRQIEKILGREFEYRKVPTPEHIIEKQLYNLADRLERVQVNEAEIGKYINGVRKKLEWLTEEDLLKRVLSLEFNRLLAYYQNMPDIDLNEKDRKDKKEKKEKGERRERREKDRREAEEGYERLMVNIGKSAGFFPGNLMELVNRNINGPKPEIGRIDLMPGYTLFDVRREDAHRVLDALRHADFFGDKIRAEVAQPGKDYASESSDRPSRGGRGKAKGKGDYKKDSRSRKPRKDEKSDKKAKAKTKGKSKEKSKKPKYNGNYDIFMK
jgi:ATP-dependent RNA helicase DeaD